MHKKCMSINVCVKQKRTRRPRVLFCLIHRGGTKFVSLPLLTFFEGDTSYNGEESALGQEGV